MRRAHDQIQPVRYVPVDLKKLATIGHPHPFQTIVKNRTFSSFWVTQTFFATAMAAYVLVGVYCLIFPPLASKDAGGVAIADSASCLRATRHADYTTVEIGVGSPVTQMSMLLRLDKVLKANDTEMAMRLFSQETVESGTVACSIQGLCEDVALIASGSNGAFEHVAIRFSYRHAAVESSMRTTASQLDGVDGELAMREGVAYWLTPTHLCYASSYFASKSDGMVTASVSASGTLVSSMSSLSSTSDMRHPPVLNLSYASLCPPPNHTSDVELFPVAAGIETSWLSISDTGLYNSEPDAVDSRRTIVELGVPCAENVAELQRSLTLYNLDCTPYGNCRSNPNMPFRRVATSSIHINAVVDGSVSLWFTKESSLDGLPKLANSTNSFALSIAKLALITLAAAIVYVRSKRPTASSSWLFKHCMTTATREGQLLSNPRFEQDISYSVTEDSLIGIIAFFSRFSITVYRIVWGGLAMDNQMRVCNTEIMASVLSLVHWVLRYRILKYDKMSNGEPPISKLGGSTAIMDSTSAVMIAFAEPPTLVVSLGKFDPTARMLVAILISIIVVTRCAFSATCCGVLWESEHYTPDRQAYSGILLYAGISWVLQAAALGVLMADLFVTPSSYSMARSLVGNVLTARLLLFFALLCAGLPRLMQTVRHIRDDGKEHRD